jgi:adenylate cyclase
LHTCAIELQRALADYEHRSEHRLAIRIGLNAGEPVEEAGDLFGSSVIVAARVAAAASGGEILVPDGVRHLLLGKPFRFEPRGEQRLKGFEEPLRLFAVEWRDG